MSVSNIVLYTFEPTGEMPCNGKKGASYVKLDVAKNVSSGIIPRFRQFAISDECVFTENRSALDFCLQCNNLELISKEHL